MRYSGWFKVSAFGFYKYFCRSQFRRCFLKSLLTGLERTLSGISFQILTPLNVMNLFLRLVLAWGIANFCFAACRVS